MHTRWVNDDLRGGAAGEIESKDYRIYIVVCLSPLEEAERKKYLFAPTQDNT